MVSKDSNDTNLFDSNVVLSNNFTLNPLMYDENALGSYSPFFLMNQSSNTVLSGSTPAIASYE